LTGTVLDERPELSRLRGDIARRNLDRVVVTTPGKLEVAALVWANSVLVTENAMELVKAKAT